MPLPSFGLHDRHSRAVHLCALLAMLCVCVCVCARACVRVYVRAVSCCAVLCYDTFHAGAYFAKAWDLTTLTGNHSSRDILTGNRPNRESA
jgi:hypothetical protein